MITLILVAVSVIVLVVVLRPLFASRNIQPLVNRKTDPGLRHDDLFAEKMKVYGHIKDIDLEYRMGKIDEIDYRRVRKEYLAQAAVVLEKLQTLQPKKKMKEPSASRAMQAAPVFEEICPACRVENTGLHKFCPECGEPLMKTVDQDR